MITGVLIALFYCTGVWATEWQLLEKYKSDVYPKVKKVVMIKIIAISGLSWIAFPFIKK